MDRQEDKPADEQKTVQPEPNAPKPLQTVSGALDLQVDDDEENGSAPSSMESSGAHGDAQRTPADPADGVAPSASAPEEALSIDGSTHKQENKETQVSPMDSREPTPKKPAKKGKSMIRSCVSFSRLLSDHFNSLVAQQKEEESIRKRSVPDRPDHLSGYPNSAGPMYTSDSCPTCWVPSKPTCTLGESMVHVFL